MSIWVDNNDRIHIQTTWILSLFMPSLETIYLFDFLNLYYHSQQKFLSNILIIQIFLYAKKVFFATFFVKFVFCVEIDVTQTAHFDSDLLTKIPLFDIRFETRVNNVINCYPPRN